MTAPDMLILLAIAGLVIAWGAGLQQAGNVPGQRDVGERG